MISYTARKHIPIYSMLLLFLATLIISVTPAKVYAAPVDTFSPENQLISYKLYFAMADCVNGSSLNTQGDGHLTDAEVAAGNWYNGSENVITGIFADPQTPPDGRMECNNIVTRSLNLWGWSGSYIAAAKEMGFKQSDGGKWSKSSTPRSDMLSAIRDKVYGGQDPVYEGWFNYFDLYNSFIEGCSAKKVADGPINDDQKALGYKQITVVDQATKTSKVMVYSHDDKTINYGEAPLAGSDDKLQCATIAANLNTATADRYVTYLTSLPPGATAPGDPGVNEGSQSVADECPLPDDTSMRWLGCSIMSLAAVATEALYGAIQTFLYTPTEMIFGNAGLKVAAEGIRNLAIGLILIAGLVMVIAQATGSDLFDAYTIRKLLPRLGVAMIGIALAWPLLEFAVTFTNVIGLLADRLLMGVTQLGSQGTGSSNDFGTNIGSTIFGSFAAGGTVLILGAMGVISLGGTLVLALLLGLLVLSVRQLVIMVCILLAPLAIAAYVLPGTQKLWGFWKNTFITTLLMFPIIMFFLASGKAFSAVLGGADSPTMSLLAIIVFIAPYFLLPFAFKLAGGLMATVFSIANDKNRGMFDRLRKGRQNAMGKNVNAIRTGSRYAGGNEKNLRGRFNRGLANTANAPGAILASGNLTKPTNWKAATRNATSTSTMAEIEKNMKENPNYATWSGDDDLNRAAAESHDEQSLRDALVRIAPARFNNTRDLDNAVARIQTVRRQMSAPAFQQMTTLQAIAGGTAYETAGEAWAAVARATQNDDAMKGSLIAKGRSAAMNAGRVDMGGAGFGDTLAAVDAMQTELRNTGRISARTQMQANDDIHAGVYRSQGGATLVHSSMKAGAVQEMAPEMVASVRQAQQAGDRDFAQSLASLSAVYDGMKGSSPQKAKIVADSVMSQEIDLNTLSASQRTMLQSAIALAQQNAQQDADRAWYDSGQIGPSPPASVSSVTYQQAIEGLRGNKQFQEMSREYATQVSAVQAQSTMVPPPGASPITPPGVLGGGP
jgi:hypothetical protein